TELTVSAAPATIRQATAGHSIQCAPPLAGGPGERVTTTPNAATASPQVTTAASTANPWRRTCPSGPDSRPASSDPAAIAATRIPTVFAPPPRTTAAMAGN